MYILMLQSLSHEELVITEGVLASKEDLAKYIKTHPAPGGYKYIVVATKMLSV